ncbi:aldehyde dehydrogenase [Zopfia rhizophila CBS 207.26]|uniref:aldehyde dehydrogenase (NAD(+)) n=1 Tax=Zopfia rhizophila CBS 207.26 TaxID=1314779 RepID=A0A6A6D7W8_9PEZI|nr:aldehyde dehydrogenase [Zopfia rhizophila CBS 207.26]
MQVGGTLHSASQNSGSDLNYVYSPHDESLVADDIQMAGQADVDAAVDAIRAAFKSPWSKLTGLERSKIMLTFADLIDKHTEEIWPLESKVMGMPQNVVKTILGMTANVYRYYADWTDNLAGEQFPEADGVYKIVHYEPLSVCAGIGAWNVSVMCFGYKAAAAVVVGCTAIFKGSEKSPLGLLALGDLVKEAGFPPGIINIITGDGRTGSMLASHMDINKTSFTGSVFAGKKCVTLELGGKSPSLTFDDADLDNASQHHSQNFLFNTDQACIAASRTFVDESIAPKFVEQLKARFEQSSHTIGSPLGPMTFLGPLADGKQFERVMNFLEIGKGEAELVTGGKRHDDLGFHVESTISLNPKDDGRIYRKEIFGPVITIRTFKAEEEVIKLANDTSYGLSSCVFTASASCALRIARQLEAGMVNVPFGGYKQSGIGREGGRNDLLAYVEAKTISINMNV